VTESLIGAEKIDQVVVDTDSDEIQAAVEDSFPDVVIHRRPKHLHGDMVPMHDVVAFFARSTSYDSVLQTHATNPLLRSETIDRAIGAFANPGDHDSLMSVTPWQSRFFFVGGAPVNHDPAVLGRTQDLDPLLEENSNIYISPTDQIVQTGLRVGTNPILFRMEREESVDIDDQIDWQLAEHLLELRRGT
jgi:CMP-N-acetylneuraminic acid synthetase